MVLWYGQSRLEFKFFYIIWNESQGCNMWTSCLLGNLVPSNEQSTKLQKRQPQRSIWMQLNAVGVYKDIDKRDNLKLAGHFPIELSRVLAGFLSSNESNSLIVHVCGKRKTWSGPCNRGWYNARTSRKKIADILGTEIKNIKEHYPHFKLEKDQFWYIKIQPKRISQHKALGNNYRVYGVYSPELRSIV